jgi:glycosyltransferase involved in cell wall biosynthesis
MKISVVTISFNQKKYLTTCIQSILNQADCDLEYIVVDPGSTDGSREVIESYGDRIVRVFEKDNGPSDGLIRGFERATGDIYGFINSDDYLLPGALSAVTQAFKQGPSDLFLTGGGFAEDAFGTRTRIRPTQLSKQGMLHRSDVMFQQSTFFPSKLYKQAKGFNPSNETCWDYELFLRFLLLGAEHQVLDKDLAVFRLYEESISGSGRLEAKYFKELDKLFLECMKRERNTKDKLMTYYLRLKRELSRRMG